MRVDDGTGAYTWPAGRRLIGDLAQVVDLRARAVIDLGCGPGGLGLAALSLGAATVAFADADAAAIDALLAQGRSAIVHRWGEPWPRPRADVVLCGDCLYRASHFPALASTISACLLPDGLAVLSDPRSTLEPELPAIFAAQGLALTQERRADYTLLRATLRR
jgi:ribosomal protein L11 methylase PrmA